MLKRITSRYLFKYFVYSVAMQFVVFLAKSSRKRVEVQKHQRTTEAMDMSDSGGDEFLDLGELRLESSISVNQVAVEPIVAPAASDGFDAEGFIDLDALLPGPPARVEYRKLGLSDVGTSAEWIVANAMRLASSLAEELDLSGGEEESEEQGR